jgi:salicylate biosynthesis isochorismate synthase/menaquinone-specific isochorismate synthase
VRTAHDTALVRIGPAEQARLRRAAQQAVRRARARGGEALAAIALPLGDAVDPVAVAVASRRDGEPWFCFEQPERGRAALAALGCVRALEGRGAGRFGDVAGAWRALAADASGDAGEHLVAVGGFAFAAGGGEAPDWAGFAPASLHVPEAALLRRGDDVSLTLAALATPDDTADDLVARIERRAAELRSAPLPLLDPDPAEHARVVSTMPPEHYEAAVARAVERIRAGELEKIVLAREVAVHAPGPHDAAAVFAVLREAFPGCFVFCAGRGDAAFVGATPELLVRREGLRASSLALAGSTRRSADPSVDSHLGERLLQSAKDRSEHEIVAEGIVRTLEPHAVWTTSAPEPVVVKVANIQHLATPIRAQLAAPVARGRARGRPPSDAGGRRRAAGARRAAHPGARGHGSRLVRRPGGVDGRERDGEFCVALRCALLRGRLARCYAGVGVVAGSDPAAELEETEIKLAALLPVLAG